MDKFQGKDIPEKCNITKRIIKLLWTEGKLSLEKYLSKHKRIIFHQLYEIYDQPWKQSKRSHQKYFHRIINRRISLNVNIDELIDFINESNCFFHNKFD